LALLSFVIRWFTDATCSATVCRAASELFSHIYIVVIIFLIIVAGTKAQQIREKFTLFQSAFGTMTNEKNKKD
jgi:hypothetical protein